MTKLVSNLVLATPSVVHLRLQSRRLPPSARPCVGRAYRAVQSRCKTSSGDTFVDRRNFALKLLPGLLTLPSPAFAEGETAVTPRAPRWVGGLLLAISGISFSWVAAKSLDATGFMEKKEEPPSPAPQAAADAAADAPAAAAEADPVALLTDAGSKPINKVTQDVNWPTDFPWPAEYFVRADEDEDVFFYIMPRFLTHIDDAAIAALTRFYSDVFPTSGKDDVAMLDICSSWISHYPEGFSAGRVAGLGMNKAELDRNAVLTENVVKDLNQDPVLPYEDDAFDVVTNAVSVDYLNKPVEVMREVNRVLKPGGLAIMSFSNRCFPTKVIQIWNQTNDAQHVFIVASYFKYAGNFGEITTLDISPNPGRSDPMYIVCARKSTA